MYLGENVEKPLELEVTIEGTSYFIRIVHEHAGKNGSKPAFSVGLYDSSDPNTDTNNHTVVRHEYDHPKAQTTSGSPMPEVEFEVLKQFVKSFSNAGTMTSEEARKLMMSNDPEEQKKLAAYLCALGIECSEAERKMLASSGGQ